jgi:hypothetical protein
MPANAKIPLLELGKGKPTMLNLSVANEVVKTVNGIRGLNFLPGGIARVDIADDTITVTLNLNQDVPTFTYPLTGTETLPDFGTGYLTIEIEDTGLPDGTPVAVDTYNLDYPIQFCGSVVSGGTIRIYYQMAVDEPPIDMPVGIITVRPIL